jgi:alkanesulfonate monooxygenase SsuD/methylene tetrahydromethanopterin reductase-like flavin-dependent oxidoreductase (luciferase family)
MKFGVSFLPDATPNEMSAEAYYAGALELCEIADRGGLHSAKMTEHFLHPYGGYCPSPLAFLTAVAARTQKLRLMTGCILPAFHHPIQLAAETAMLDAISGGRLDVGFARAYLPYEFASFGVSLDESKERFRETIRTVIRLWTEPSVTVETPFFAFRDAHSMPSPVQSPHPPVWGAAVRSAESFAWLGREGFNLLITGSLSSVAALSDSVAIYRKAFMERHGAAGKTPHAAVSLPLFIAPTDAEAEAECDLYLQRYLDVWLGAASSWDNVSSRDYPGYTGMSWAIRSTSPAQLRAAGGAVAGSPDHVAAAITTLRETLGVDQILWQIDFGAMPTELARQTLTRFIEDVAPRFA